MKTSRHYRAAVEQVEVAAVTQAKAHTTAKLRSAAAIKGWLLTVGPVYLRFRWYAGIVVDARTGVMTVKGSCSGRRETITLVGYDEQARFSTSERAHETAKANPFRALSTRGSAFGQAGRVWLSAAALTRMLKDGGTAIGVKL